MYYVIKKCMNMAFHSGKMFSYGDIIENWLPNIRGQLVSGYGLSQTCELRDMLHVCGVCV